MMERSAIIIALGGRSALLNAPAALEPGPTATYGRSALRALPRRRRRRRPTRAPRGRNQEIICNRRRPNPPTEEPTSERRANRARASSAVHGFVAELPLVASLRGRKRRPPSLRSISSPGAAACIEASREGGRDPGGSEQRRNGRAEREEK